MAQAVLDRLEFPRVTMMTTMETFKLGDEVLSPCGSKMTVLAVEGMKVRCSDEQDRQYWFDTSLLERRYWTRSDADTTGQDLFPQSFPELLDSGNPAHACEHLTRAAAFRLALCAQDLSLSETGGGTV